MTGRRSDELNERHLNDRRNLDDDRTLSDSRRSLTERSETERRLDDTLTSGRTDLDKSRSPLRPERRLFNSESDLSDRRTRRDLSEKLTLSHTLDRRSDLSDRRTRRCIDQHPSPNRGDLSEWWRRTLSDDKRTLLSNRRTDLSDDPGRCKTERRTLSKRNDRRTLSGNDREDPTDSGHRDLNDKRHLSEN